MLTWYSAAMPGGSFLGALISGYISDILGRKKAIQIGSIIWCIGSILVCASNGIPMLIVGRIINGLSVGICSAQGNNFNNSLILILAIFGKFCRLIMSHGLGY
jgi:MFS family permease